MTLLLDHPHPVAPEIDDDITRREFIVGAGAAALLAACGADDEQENVSPSTTTSPRGAFPVTIDHKYGSTEIPAEPKRVVTVGLTEQDFVLALGVAPVATTEWFGDRPGALWPWARDLLDDRALPEVLNNTDGINFERVASLQPDLIIGVDGGLSDTDYATLSRIAPTLAQSADFPDYDSPWQDRARSVGRALGRDERAEELIAMVEAGFAEARDDHPEFDGATGVIASDFGDGSIFLNRRSRFLTDLGFELPVALAEVRDAGGEISGEQLELLEADVLVWAVYEPDKARVEDNPLYQRLDVAREGRDLFAPEDHPANAAIAFKSPPSLLVALEALVPRLAAAIDGDPATEPEALS